MKYHKNKNIPPTQVGGHQGVFVRKGVDSADTKHNSSAASPPQAAWHSQSISNKYFWIILAIIAVLALSSYFIESSFGILGERAYLEELIGGFGVFAPLVIILLITIEVLFAPLPGGILPIIASVLFGLPLGIFYSWIGNVGGSIIAFFIARRYGKRVIKFFAPSFDEKEYDIEVANQKGVFWAFYAIPVVPVDVISFALGASAVPFRQFFYAIVVAFLIRMTIWNFFGDALANFLFI